ncbi:hypothetical protein ACWEKM_46100 [Streptomyces sp. NPDC004752]
MTESGPLGEPVPSGALAERLVCAGALEAGPLAESDMDGEDGDGCEVGDSEAGGCEVDGVVGGFDVGGVDVGGFDVGGLLVGGWDGEPDEPSPPGPRVPLGPSDGPVGADDDGVGPFEVPGVPPRPGSAGLLVAVPVSPLSSLGVSAPRPPPSVP